MYFVSFFQFSFSRGEPLNESGFTVFPLIEAQGAKAGVWGASIFPPNIPPLEINMKKQKNPMLFTPKASCTVSNSCQVIQQIF